VAETLRARGVQTWLHTDWEDRDARSDVTRADLVVAIGGDGAMLRAARVCAPERVPVLGINMGQLGFLTEIADPADWDDRLDTLLRGDYWIEQRMMLTASLVRDGVTIECGEALNDVVISGSVVGRMIQIDTYIDDDWATTYSADALVIATATGSTAYALACGGPILPPELRNILVVPAAPHLSMDRPLVLAEGARVAINASSGNRSEIVLTADGGVLAHLGANDQVVVQASEHISRFVRLRGRNYFYRSLLDRLEPRVQRQNGTDE
jgi:NAD+ kinase